MEFETQILHSVRETDPASWDRLSQGHPFASYRWYHFGEAVLSDNLPIYIILSHKGEPVARATLWLRRQEQLPISSKALRWLLKAILRRWPLLMCQSPVADASGLILPEPPLREEALRLITRVAQQQAKQHHASFTAFTYLEENEVKWAGWPADFVTTKLSEPGTRLVITWGDFEDYMAHLSKSVRKDYRRHHNRATELGIEIERQPAVPLPDEAITLIRNVEAQHDSAPNPWARSILAHANKVDATWLTAKLDGRLVGCGLLLQDGPHAIMRLLGRDYRIQYAYFQLVYEAIRCAIEKGVQVLWGGSGAYEMKLRLGFQLTNDTCTIFRAGNSLLHRLAQYLA